MTVNCQKSFFSTSQHDRASSADFILFHIGKEKINTRREAKYSRVKKETEPWWASTLEKSRFRVV
jgi:hypothetical protein